HVANHHGRDEAGRVASGGKEIAPAPRPSDEARGAEEDGQREPPPVRLENLREEACAIDAPEEPDDERRADRDAEDDAKTLQRVGGSLTSGRLRPGSSSSRTRRRRDDR